MILIWRYGDPYGRVGDQCCIRDSWRVCYHGLANNLHIIMEYRITKRIISLTAFSLDWERSDRIHQGYKTNKSEVPANDKNSKKYCVRICQLLHFFQRRGCGGILHYLIYSLVFLLTSSRIKIKIPPSLSFFSMLLVCFSLGSKFIFIDNCFEINEMNHILNCGHKMWKWTWFTQLNEQPK